MNRVLRLVLLRWHRRLGVVIALIVAMLVITGIALNHTEQLELDQRPVRQPTLLARYGVESPAVVSFAAGGQLLSLVGQSRLYLDEREVAYCEAPLKSVVSYRSALVALCADQLLVLTREGDVVERFSDAYGLPPEVSALGVAHNRLWLRLDNGVVTADLDTLQFEAATPPPALDWSTPEPTPAPLRATLTEQYLGDDVHWERVLLDLHTGRLFGVWGVYLVDAAAIGLLLLAFSGVWVWLTKPGRWRRGPSP